MAIARESKKIRPVFDEKKAIEAFIAVEIVPFLPKYSYSQVYYGVKGSPRPEEASQFFANALLIKLLHQIIEDMFHYTYLSRLVAVHTVLAEHLKVGNCQEQAQIAAMKLLSCESVRAIIMIVELGARDHVYLEVLTQGHPRQKKWRYDPWLDPKKLYTTTEHNAELRELFQAEAHPADLARVRITSDDLSYLDEVPSLNLPAHIVEKMRQELKDDTLPEDFWGRGSLKCASSDRPLARATALARLDATFRIETTPWCYCLTQKICTVAPKIPEALATLHATGLAKD